MKDGGGGGGRRGYSGTPDERLGLGGEGSVTLVLLMSLGGGGGEVSYSGPLPPVGGWVGGFLQWNP